jgi:rhodanese-related sulfurtransferase
MNSGSGPRVGEIMPTDAWTILATDKDARLVDVRTQAEWAYVGVPDLSGVDQTLIRVEWVQLPGMSVNPHFADAVMDALGDTKPDKLLFICRSGVRSLHAAQAMAGRFADSNAATQCLNVAEGFEGDLNQDGHRGFHSGWKHRGLAWRQS